MQVFYRAYIETGSLLRKQSDPRQFHLQGAQQHDGHPDTRADAHAAY